MYSVLRYIMTNYCRIHLVSRWRYIDEKKGNIRLTLNCFPMTISRCGFKTIAKKTRRHTYVACNFELRAKSVTGKWQLSSWSWSLLLLLSSSIVFLIPLFSPHEVYIFEIWFFLIFGFLSSCIYVHVSIMRQLVREKWWRARGCACTFFYLYVYTPFIDNHTVTNTKDRTRPLARGSPQTEHACSGRGDATFCSVDDQRQTEGRYLWNGTEDRDGKRIPVLHTYLR